MLQSNILLIVQYLDSMDGEENSLKNQTDYKGEKIEEFWEL